MNNEPSINSLYKVNVSEIFGKEYTKMFEFLLQMVTIQTVIQFMLYFTNPTCFSLFSKDFCIFILFLIVLDFYL